MMQKIYDVILGVSILVAIFVLIWYIVGNSPTSVQLFLPLIVALLVYVMNQNNKNTRMIYTTREYMLKEFSKIHISLAKKQN